MINILEETNIKILLLFNRDQDLLGKETNVVIKKISMHTIYGEVVSHDKNLAA